MNPSELVDVTDGDVVRAVDVVLGVGLWIYDFVMGLAGWLIANVGVLSGPPEAILGLLIVVLLVGTL
ncbi:hypothetical protein [Halalkalicoccus salilacus]|uniref:hypothetical protein n=1 Tax=Halalkalicoccus TaxID=332246 RepID=UPI002F965DA5